jgi:lipid II:glycine glycyltransferase (peptidoglycan interpeptide bridge formation enzyme)
MTIQTNDMDRENWNTFVERQGHFSLLQSWDWGEFKKRSGWRVRRIGLEKQGKLIAGAQMLIKSFVPGLVSFAYIPRGPLVDWKDKETTAALLDAIHAEARKHKAICLRIEPPLLHTAENHQLMQSYGFQASAHTIQPRCTMIIQLSRDTEELLRSFQKYLRKNIQRSQIKGVKVDTGTAEDLKAFFHLMKVTSQRANFLIRSYEYYEQEWKTFHPPGQAQLFIASYEDIPVAAMLSVRFGKHAAAFHAGSLQEYHGLRANDLVWWTAIKWAKDQGCHTYDLWGIPDEVGEMTIRNEPIPGGMRGGLWGVYYYKRHYRGDVVYYVGAYDYVYSPILHKSLDFLISHVFSIDRLVRIADRFIKP